MSFSASVIGTREEIVGKLDEAFETSNPTPAEGVQEMYDAAKASVEAFASESDDAGEFSVAVSGHACQEVDGVAQDSRDWITVSIQPKTS